MPAAVALPRATPQAGALVTILAVAVLGRRLPSGAPAFPGAPNTGGGGGGGWGGGGGAGGSGVVIVACYIGQTTCRVIFYSNGGSTVSDQLVASGGTAAAAELLRPGRATRLPGGFPIAG